jgi:redox-sensitive bicupin YhaK (pirin superfamily)
MSGGSPSGAIARLVEGRPRDLGGFSVRRLLPAGGLMTVGPFIFLDHIGPVTFPAGAGLDVRPHPHIGLATVTYLFEGEIFHRDSLGNALSIQPGDVNWMVAGRGIAHSERTAAALRTQPSPLHGIQSWVALPACDEETEPSFVHHPGATLPEREIDGTILRVIAGTAFGLESPVRVFSPTLYVDARLADGATLALPAEHAERAVYVAAGAVYANSSLYETGCLLVLEEGESIQLQAPAGARLMLLGGAPLEGPRYIWWNFVSSRRERIDQASEDWREGRFAAVPGETERIPLP